MPKLPTNLKDLKSYNELLGDISTKLDKLSSLGEGLLHVDVESFFSANDAISKFEEKLRNAAKIAPELTKGLAKYSDIQKKSLAMAKEKAKLQKKEQEFLEKAKKLERGILDLTEDENKELIKTQDRLDEINDEYKDINKQLTSTKVLASSIAKIVGGSLLNAVDSVATSAVNFGLSITGWSFDKVITGLKMVYDLQERATKAAGDFSLHIGAFTKDFKSASKNAQELDGQLRALTGGGIGEGYKAFEEFSDGLGMVNEATMQFTKGKLADNLIGVARASGISNQDIGQLAKTISIMDDSFTEGKKDTIEFAKSMKDAAGRAGVSVAKFGKDIMGSMSFMNSFGKKGKEIFLKTAEYASKMGISLKGLESFTDLTDTFEGSAEAAAKMNTVFGTSINAMELMLENDPSKRFENFRQQMLAQGKTAASMSRQEIKFASQSLSISEDDINAALREGKTIDEIAKTREKAAKAREKQETTTREALAMTAQTLYNFQLAWDGATKKIMKALAPLLQMIGLIPKEGEKTSRFGDNMNRMFERLGKVIDKVANNKRFQTFLKGVSSDIESLFGKVDEFLGGDGIDKLIDSVTATLETFYGLVKKVFNFIWDHKDGILNFFKFVAEHMGTVVALLAGAKFAKMVMGVMQFASSTKDLFSSIGSVAGGGKAISTAASAASAAAPGAEAAIAGGGSALASGGAAAGVGAAGAAEGGAAAGGAGLLGIGLGPILAIVAAIAAAVWTAYQAVQAFQKNVGGLADSIKSHFSAIVDRLEDIFQPLLDNIINPIWETIKEITAPIMQIFGGDGTLGEFFGSAVLKWIDNMLAQWDTFLLAFQVVIEYIKEFAGIIKDVAGPYMDQLKQGWDSIKKTVGEFFTSVGQSISAQFKMVGDAFQLIVGKLANIPIIGEAFKNVKDFFSGIGAAGGGIIDSVQQDIASKVSAIEARRAARHKAGDANAGTPESPSAEMVLPEMDLTADSASKGTGPSKEKNYAVKKAAEKKGKELVLVAGDVFLDSNLVGRHLLRGASSN